jgi:hypothetical protein
MAIIVDLDDLTITTDIVINETTSPPTIQILTTGAVQGVGEGAETGVSGQALYSFLKDQWKTNATYIKYPFPMEAITPEQFEFINDWEPADDATRKLIRSAGWAERTAAGVLKREYIGVVSLGSLGAIDQPYYELVDGGVSAGAVDFTYQGRVNEAVQIFGDVTNGNVDYRLAADEFNVFCREQGKTYAASNNTAIGATDGLTYITYRFPLANATDLNITASDAQISTPASIWDGITVDYLTVGDSLSYDIDDNGTPEIYSVIIQDSNGTATNQQIYEKIQYLLRQNVDINAAGTAGVKIGKLEPALLAFVGDTLNTGVSWSLTGDGVVVNNLASLNKAFISIVDDTGTTFAYPSISSGNIQFGAFAGNGDFKYFMFFRTGVGAYGSAGATLVDDALNADITGIYTGADIPFDFAYTKNTQNGRSPDTDVPITLVGIGLDGGQFIKVDYTITEGAGNNFLLAPAQERNYSDPAP